MWLRDTTTTHPRVLCACAAVAPRKQRAAPRHQHPSARSLLLCRHAAAVRRREISTAQPRVLSDLAAAAHTTTTHPNVLCVFATAQELCGTATPPPPTRVCYAPEPPRRLRAAPRDQHHPPARARHLCRYAAASPPPPSGARQLKKPPSMSIFRRAMRSRDKATHTSCWRLPLQCRHSCASAKTVPSKRRRENGQRYLATCTAFCLMDAARKYDRDFLKKRRRYA